MIFLSTVAVLVGATLVLAGALRSDLLILAASPFAASLVVLVCGGVVAATRRDRQRGASARRGGARAGRKPRHGV